MFTVRSAVGLSVTNAYS